MGFKTSQTPIVMGSLVDALLSALGTIPAKALLLPCDVRLFANDVPVTRKTQLTDLVEPTFPGYAAANVAALNGPLALDTNNDGMSADVTFKCNAAPTASELIYGYFLTDTAGTALLMAERFDVPQPIASADDFVNVQVVIPEPFGRGWIES